jgi:outer membrane receptor protein involved in Fe transport
MQDEIPRAGRRWLACTAVAVAAVAGAQEQDVEQVVVTGSRISRPDFESASPIVSVDQDAFERAASSTVDTALNRMPQFVPQYTNTSNNPGNGGRANVQLRGLGSEATLVLLDGRRLVPADPNGVVDVNVIPASLVESAEVITGGASAVYGSDAIAGVVNFKLKRKFDGVQVDGRWGETGQGDAREYSLGVTAGTGFADGRGEALGYVGYTKRDDVTNADRSWSKYAVGYYGPEVGFLAEGSPSIAQGRPAFPRNNSPAPAAFAALFAGYGYRMCAAPDDTNCVPYQRRFGVNQDGTLFTQGTGAPGSVANFRGEQDPSLYNDRLYTYNFAPWNYLQLPLERTSAFGRLTFELPGGAELFAEALLADYSADQQLAPTPAFNLYVPRSNPYISPDLAAMLDARPSPTAQFTVAKRFDELGPRISSNQHDVYQLTTGLHSPIGGEWTLDAYVQYGDTDSRERQSGNALRSRIHELTFAADGGASICGQFDLFGIGRISDDCAKYISVSAENRSSYEQWVVEVTATGRLATLPAGDVQVALGAMYKHDESFYNGDPIGAIVLDDDIEDIQGFSASDDVEGSDSNTDLYVEALVPILADLKGAERLEIGLGYRHSEYRSAGGTAAWKVDLLYQPVQPFRLRSSFQHAVRAPSVFELYLPLLPTGYDVLPNDPDLADPCNAGSPQRADPTYGAEVLRLCLEHGVPADLLADFQDSTDLYLGVYGGNPDLEPESADTLTVGFVLNPDLGDAALGDLQVSVDWYLMEVEDSIESALANQYIPWCYDPGTNPGLEVSNRWCGHFSRDPETGDITGIRDILVNKQGYDVSGIDAQLDWTLPFGPGQLGINLLASWLDYFETVPPPGVKGDDQAGYVGGFIGGAYPEWKINVNLRYDVGGLGVGTEWRYIDGMLARDPQWHFRVPDQGYLGLYALYQFAPGMLDGLTLRAGMENLTDAEPPIFPSYIAANTDPSQYDVLGRRYYLEMVYRF